MEQYQIAGFWILAATASELRRIGTRLNGKAGAAVYLSSADDWAAVAAYAHVTKGI